MDPPDAELQDELRARIAALKAERPQADYTWSFADDKIRGSTSRVGIMLRRGWEASLQQVKDHIITLGVVAALLLSVILGLAVEAPEPVESDDRLADARPRIREAFICLCMLSSVFSITAVVKVVSAREWLTFDRYFFEEMVEWPVLWPTLIVLELPTAAVACGMLASWSVLVLVMIERSAIRVKKGRQETTTTLRLYSAPSGPGARFPF